MIFSKKSGWFLQICIGSTEPCAHGLNGLNGKLVKYMQL